MTVGVGSEGKKGWRCFAKKGKRQKKFSFETDEVIAWKERRTLPVKRESWEHGSQGKGPG